MRQWLGVTDTPAEWTGAVVTIGDFDGVHLGHQRTLASAVDLARRLDRPAVVATYDAAESVQPRLTGPQHRAALLEALGVDGVCMLPATQRPDRLPAAEFARQVLAPLRARALVAGADFRIGPEPGARPADCAEDLGVDVYPVPMLDGASSAGVRELLTAGEVAAAAAVLGRDHRVEGTVVRGADRGASQLGFPTANVDSPGHPAVPADGVYAGHLVVRGRPLPAAVSVGTNPTFAGADRTVEAYILDFSGDLYGEAVGVEFRAYLRGQVRFDSVEALVEQMSADVEDVRRVLGRVAAG